ncbi:MAG: hypothetical protein IKP35_01140 [Alphaproteobacteria bacterium]|nr:hypothetical protein [Alphaproteobacteria bacterium]
MKKIFEFLKQNPLIVKWTIWYIFVFWLITRFVFNFDMFSRLYWWKFFHATFHGFWGLTFVILVYSAIPIYIATTLTIYRKKALLFNIPLISYLPIISKLFAKKVEPVKEEVAPETEEEAPEEEYPADLPREMRVPYTRAKQHQSFMGNVSVYNKRPVKTPVVQAETEENPNIPIPMDFDLGDDLNQDMNDSVPTFTDINFDTPIATEKELENNTTKYFASHNIEFETYKEYVATEKYVIYEHADEDFWIMDNESWFAAGKQIDTPIPELISLAKQNNLTPVLYLASQNIMDIENTIKQFTDAGVKVITKLEELD